MYPLMLQFYRRLLRVLPSEPGSYRIQVQYLVVVFSLFISGDNIKFEFVQRIYCTSFIPKLVVVNQEVTIKYLFQLYSQDVPKIVPEPYEVRYLFTITSVSGTLSPFCVGVCVRSSYEKGCGFWHITCKMSLFFSPTGALLVPLYGKPQIGIRFVIPNIFSVVLTRHWSQ